MHSIERVVVKATPCTKYPHIAAQFFRSVSQKNSTLSAIHKIVMDLVELIETNTYEFHKIIDHLSQSLIMIAKVHKTKQQKNKGHT